MKEQLQRHRLQRATAATLANAAQAYVQEDDINVLTLTRTAAVTPALVESLPK